MKRQLKSRSGKFLISFFLQVLAFSAAIHWTQDITKIFVLSLYAQVAITFLLILILCGLVQVIVSGLIKDI